MRCIAGATLLATAAASIPTGFEHHFSCPFSRVWLEHGAEKAAKLLGIQKPHLGAEAVGNVTRCTAAPGYPGGAHQAPKAPGYGTDCKGTPGEGSPYMFPLRWKAQQASWAISAGSNAPVKGGFPSKTGKGFDYYRFDKNWKRGDSYNDAGVLSNTVLHKNDEMTFITWGDNGTKITMCGVMGGMPVGNLRPDFFLDNLGGAPIDAQYLGKEHVFYRDLPRLVRKWRKNDFVNTVFTISIDEYPDSNGTHWPLMLNIPGEGMGPDGLRVYWDHEVLAEDDLAPFLIDEAHKAAGGLCIKIPSGGGPPPAAPAGALSSGGDVPSALDKDDNAWRSVVWTGSPNASNTTTAPTPAPPPVAPGAMVCGVCRHMYDAAKDGDGKPFEQLPASWVCPVCGAPKSAYKKTQRAGEWAHQ